MPITVQKYNKKNLELHIAYCRRALELFIKKKKKKERKKERKKKGGKRQNKYEYCLKFSYTSQFHLLEEIELMPPKYDIV